MVTRRSGLAVGLLVLVSCAPSGAAVTSSAPSRVVAPAARAGCVASAAARGIWTTLDASLNAVVLDPRHQGLNLVSTGAALAQLRQYIQRTLVVHDLTEREVDALDSLAVSTDACTGEVLRVTIATRATRDDYLRKDGSVDHSDPMVGVEVHLLETFTRGGGVWKESAVQNLDTPTPAPIDQGPIV